MTCACTPKQLVQTYFKLQSQFLVFLTLWMQISWQALDLFLWFRWIILKRKKKKESWDREKKRSARQIDPHLGIRDVRTNFVVNQTLFVVAKFFLQLRNTMFCLSVNSHSMFKIFALFMFFLSPCPTLPEVCRKVTNLAFALLVPPSVFHLQGHLSCVGLNSSKKPCSGAHFSQVFGLSWKMTCACTPKQLVQTYFKLQSQFLVFLTLWMQISWQALDLFLWFRWIILKRKKKRRAEIAKRKGALVKSIRTWESEMLEQILGDMN